MTWTLVTGGAKGLGAEICRTLAENGHDILIHYKTSKSDAEAVKNECLNKGVKAEILHGDFSSPKLTQKFIRDCLTKHPDVQNLINNVGNFPIISAMNTHQHIWEAVFQVNFHAPVAITQALMPAIKRLKGSVINIGTSGLNAIRANTVSPAYNASKQSLLLFTKSLAKELASDHIRVNMVSPGKLENTVDRPDDLTTLPMQRLGTLQEVARFIAFLLKSENAYITGQNIEIAGGLGL